MGLLKSDQIMIERPIFLRIKYKVLEVAVPCLLVASAFRFSQGSFINEVNRMVEKTGAGFFDFYLQMQG